MRPRVGTRVSTRSAVLLLAASAYLALTLPYLSVFPPVGEDEPWIAAAPYKLATQGVYGSDLFAGYYGADRHNYQHMPLYPLLQAAVFKALGAGVWQMRLLPVAFGLALLVVTFLVGERMGGVRVGTLAVILMLGLRIGSDGPETGVLLLDRARINRYDIAVPVFGLVALLLVVRARAGLERRTAFVIGILTGLASLSHLFGIFWLPIFMVAGLFGAGRGQERWSAPAILLAGAIVAWLPWIVYIAGGWADFLGQMRFVSPRFELLEPSFYVSNVMHGGGPLSWDWIWRSIRDLSAARIGAWAVVLGVPVATIAAMASARRRDESSQVPAIVACVLAVQFGMFLALLRVKTVNYMIGIAPLALLLLAWFAVWLWDRRNLMVRIAVVAVVAAVALEGMSAIARAGSLARLTVPYEWYTREVARCIPPGARVLGLQHYWLGLRQFDYRTWLVAANYANPVYYHDPMPLDEAIERIDPDVILIDRHMARFFDEAAAPNHPFHALRTGFDAFMARRGAEPVCAIHNRTYDTMRVFRIPESRP